MACSRAACAIAIVIAIVQLHLQLHLRLSAQLYCGATQLQALRRRNCTRSEPWARRLALPVGPCRCAAWRTLVAGRCAFPPRERSSAWQRPRRAGRSRTCGRSRTACARRPHHTCPSGGARLIQKPGGGREGGGGGRKQRALRKAAARASSPRTCPPAACPRGRSPLRATGQPRPQWGGSPVSLGELPSSSSPALR